LYVTVTPRTTEPSAAEGTVQAYVNGLPVGTAEELHGGGAKLRIDSAALAGATSVTVRYSGGQYYNSSTGTAAL